MSFRRRKHHKPAVTPPPPPEATGTVPKSVSEIPAALGRLVQEAADLARRELGDIGRITPKALFVLLHGTHQHGE